ncbi:MAG: hypothetical protein JNL67_17960 [Planctomycetaceae bacterium]|nr:hypothetical protein [Planctomycetaceae bacterium]
MKLAATRYNWQRSAISWLETAANDVSPELNPDESKLLLDAVVETKSQVSNQLSSLALSDFVSMQQRLLPMTGGWSEIPDEGQGNVQLNPWVVAAASRRKLQPKIDGFREWELQLVDASLNDLPLPIRQKVLPALEQCRLAEFGIANYVRWIAIAHEPLMTDVELREMERRIDHQMADVDRQVSEAVVEIDRKILALLPESARTRFERQLGFPIEKLPDWRGQVSQSTYESLWLPFERRFVRVPDVAMRCLEPYLNGQSREQSLTHLLAYRALPYDLLVRVPRKDLRREYGLQRYSPEQIQAAVAANLADLRRALAVGAVDTTTLEPETRGAISAMAEFQITNIEQWLLGDPLRSSLDDWDFLYSRELNYWRHFASVSESPLAATRAPVATVGRLGPDVHGGSQWQALLRYPDREFGQVLDLTERQQEELQVIWSDYSATDRKPVRSDADHRRMLQDLESVLTPGQAVIGFQMTVAAWGPFRILIHPVSAEEYDLSDGDRQELKSLVERERARLSDWRYAKCRETYLAILASLPPAVLGQLVQQVGLSSDRIASCLADIDRDAGSYASMPLRYRWFDEYYDHGRTAPLADDSFFRQLMRANQLED